MAEFLTVYVIDFGGDAQSVARKIRGRKVFCEVVPYNIDTAKIADKSPAGLVFCRGTVSDLPFIEAKAGLEKLGVPFLDFDLNGAESDKELDVFLFETCGLAGNWTMENYAEKSISELAAKTDGKKILLALSGGVDSSVCAALLAKAAGDNLTCILVDHGLMRKNEADEVESAFEDKGLNFVRVNAEDRFLSRLAGIVDPEQKRKIIGEEFIRVFEEEATKIGKVDFLAQGTIYPDIIESGIGGHLVKSHHNVGGLPDAVDFKEILEPLKELFKDEVRSLGLVLGLPENIVRRQPFPGPGLGVRVIGEITKAKLDILREADFIFRSEMAADGFDKTVNQYFAIITDMRSVGVKNGKRTYDYTIALRAIRTGDFMTARAANLPFEFLDRVSQRITGEVEGINRVVYDITSKPPATIEWE